MAYLDGAHPGWVGWVDLFQLDVADTSACVLAQIDAHEQGRGVMGGSYWHYLIQHKRGYDPAWPVQHGFAGRNVLEVGGYAALVGLTNAWREAMLARRGQESDSATDKTNQV